MPAIKQENMEALTADRLRQVLHYDPLTGVFTWRMKLSNAAPVGKIAASVVGNYRGACIDGIKYYLHRLAFLYMTGAWPKHEVDHWNGVGSDNRWKNLREATSGQNKANRVPTSSVGILGVNRSSARCRHPFEASICSGGYRRRIGYFDTVEEAAAAYAKAAVEVHGEFART